jgi:hypothetical protein
MAQSGSSGLVDRLNDRGVVDRWGFLLFAFVGAGAILVAKAIQANTVLVAIGAVLAMASYAAVVQRAGSGRLRADQAGDNCYYLGLIYTLSSLSYAIFTFDPNDTATTIVQGFGIALATTIVGLVLRVFFNQSRVDLVQTEDTARIELADAAGRLKAELSSAVVSFNDFGRQTRQSLEEFRAEVLKSLAEAREAADVAVRNASAEANAALTAQTTEALAKAKRLSSATEKVVEGIERHANVLGKVEAATDGISKGLAALQDAAAVTQEAMKAQADQAAQLHQIQSDTHSTSRELKDSVSQLLENMRAFEGMAGRFDTMIGARLDEVRLAPEKIVAEANTRLERVLSDLNGNLEKTVAAQRELTAKLAAQVGDSVALVERHNLALDAELLKSRDNVAKVHSALVEMTGELADRLEHSGS